MKNIFSFLGLTFIILGFISLTENSLFPGWWAILPTSGAFLIMFVGPNAFIKQYFLSNPIIDFFIGKISYPLYL